MPGSTMWRCLMPVRCRIHSFDGVDQLLEVVVRQQLRRHVGREARDLHAAVTGRPEGLGYASLAHHRRSFPGAGRPKYSYAFARRDTAARRAIEEPDLDQERLVNVLERVPFFAHGCREAGDTDRAAAELLDDRAQQPPIHFVESVLVDLEQLQRAQRHVMR